MTSLLDYVRDPDRARILEASRVRKVRKGDVLAHEGEPGAALYLVESGCICVRTTTADGESVILDIVGPGSVLGEMALVRENMVRTASLIAMQDGAVRVLTAEAFASLRAQYPSVNDALLAILADRVDRLSHQVSDQRFVTLDRRIAARICQIADMYGGIEMGTRVPLTQQDIADLVGATRPTVNQALKKLEARGAIALSRGGLTIVNGRELRKRAGL